MKFNSKANVGTAMLLHDVWRGARITSAIGTVLIAVALLSTTGIAPLVLIALAPAIAFVVSRFFEKQYKAIVSDAFDSMFEPCPCETCHLGRS
jgi:hypothetical protein